MIEQPTNSPREGTAYVGTRVLIAGGAGMLLAFGLCGMSAVTGRLGQAASTLAVFGAGLFVLSVLVLVIGAIVLVIELIARR